MIEISILELLYLVATFFLVIIGTLITVSLIRVNKILRVWTELADYYQNMKKVFMAYSMVPYVIKDKIFDYIAGEKNTDESPQEATEK